MSEDVVGTVSEGTSWGAFFQTLIRDGIEGLAGAAVAQEKKKTIEKWLLIVVAGLVIYGVFRK